MKKKLIAALTAAVVCVSGAAFAQDDQAELPTFSPIETYTCTYKEGKGPADLDAAVAAWNAWMDEEGVTSYWAATVTPYYFGPDAFDFGWLGAWSSGATMGTGTDTWLSEGGEYAAKFAAVMDCDTHSAFAGTEIKEPPGDGNPDNIVLTFTDCNIAEIDGIVDLFAALNAWAEYSTERGYQNGTWLLFPAYGGGGAEFDFKIVNSYENHAAMGTNWDLFASGDYVKHGELTGAAYECDDARVYNAKIRRRMAENE